MESKIIPITPEAIEAILPQTQCGLCDYEGCKPYAEAIAAGEDTIDHCPPGGLRGLKKLATLTGTDSAPFIDAVSKLEKPRLLAVVREDECIGCTKCIQACPVDAILGAAKVMHTVIVDECSGCELCLAPCPVDCIDLINVGCIDDLSDEAFAARSKQYRDRYDFRNKRLEDEALQNRKQHKTTKQHSMSVDAKKAYIDAALKRVRDKKKPV